MIKATDLRVRNLLNYHTAEGDILPSKMDWQDFKWIDEDEKGFNLVHSPILITDELLINAGAKKIGENSYNLNGMQINFTDGKWIEYVHQMELTGIHHLQNVFYFTTGKELIFKD
jgi:hypothetical protein